jgi:uncharacterized protein (PEP-CTERM system associated)
MARARRDAQGALPASLGHGVIYCRNLLRVLSLSTLLAYPAWAVKWDVVPTLSVAETYTDNVSLEQDELKRSDWVTQVIPGISIAATGAQLKFNLNYAPALIYHARGEVEDKVFQRLNATGTAELAKQLLYLDAGAFINPVNVSLLGPLTASLVNDTGNIATAKTTFASPYLVQDFGSFARGEARYTHSAVNYDYDDNTTPTTLSNSAGERVNLRLGSGPAHKLNTWDIALMRESLDFESQPDTRTELGTVNARRLLSSTVGLLAQAGYENYDLGVPGAEAKGPRWSAGLDWTPTPRTRVAATGGRRFFGDAYSFDFRHRTRVTAWSASYTQDVSSAHTEFFAPPTTSTAGYLNPLFSSRFPDPNARQKAVEEFMAQTGISSSLGAPINCISDQPFLAKRAQASFGLLGVRNVVIANAFNENREALAGTVAVPATGDFAVSNTIRQTGASLAWTWRITGSSSWNMRAGFTRNDFLDVDRVDDLTELRMGVSVRFQPRVTGHLYYQRQQSDSNVSTSSFTENSGTAMLQMSF